MSYEIVYNHFTVKVADKYIPFVLWGSNNCYQMSEKGRQIRERNWASAGFLLRDKLYFSSLEEIEQSLINMYSPGQESFEEWSANFSSHTCLTYSGRETNTLKQWQSLFVNSAKKAIPLEDLIDAGIALAYGKGEALNVFRSLDDLELAMVTARLLGEKINGYDFTVSGNLDWFLKKRRVKKSKPAHTYLDVESYWVLKDANGKVLCRYTPRGYRYTPYVCSASKHFPNEKEAAKYAAVHNSHTWTPTLVERGERLKVSSSMAHKYSVKKQERAFELTAAA